MKKVTLFLVISMFMSLKLEAVVRVGNKDCPTQFEGRVIDIIQDSVSSGLFSLNKVIFQYKRSIKGKVKDVVFVDMLQNGPFQVEKDKEYLIHLRDGKLCLVKEI